MPNSSASSGAMRPDGDRARRRALAHQLVDVAVEVVVERRRRRRRRARGRPSSRRRRPRPARPTAPTNARRAAGQQQQRHHARLGQRDVVARGRRTAARCAAEGLGAEEARSPPNASDAAARWMPRRGQQRGEAEEDERRDARPGSRRRAEIQASTTSPASGGSASAASSRCAVPQPAAPETTASAGPDDRADREQPRPGPDHEAVTRPRRQPPRRSRNGRGCDVWDAVEVPFGRGEVAYHSSVSAEPGIVARAPPVRVVLTTFATNTSMPTAITYEPIVETML